MFELLIEREYPPIFPDVVPHSYLDARKEYAGKYAYPFVWRDYYTCYHPECMKMVLANRCRSDHEPLTEEELDRYRSVRTPFTEEDFDRRRTAYSPFTEEELNRWVYSPGHLYGAQFIRIKDARSYLTRCVWLPSWCQYCMQFFWEERSDGRCIPVSGDVNFAV